jgi:hypothetical protein
MAQQKYNITGQVKDTSGQPLPGAGVWLYYSNDSLRTSCNDKGYFNFSQIDVNVFRLKATMLGYESFYGNYTYTIPLSIVMTPRPELLQEVIIKSQSLPVSMKNDTIEYNISQYHLREDAILADLFKRLPGLEYDQNGNLKFMGQPINKIRINGEDVLVGNIRDLIRLIPLGTVGKIQVLDDYGKMAELTGRSTGMANKVINLETKKGLETTHSLTILAGVGSSKRYNTDINASIINNRKQIIAEVLADNTIPGASDNSYSKALFLFRNQLNDLLYTSGGVFAERNKIRQVANSSATTLTTAGMQNNENESGSSLIANNYYFVERLNFKDKKSNSLKFQITGKHNDQTEQLNTHSVQTGIQHLEQSIENITHTTSPEILSNLYGSIHLPHKGELLAFGIETDFMSSNSDQHTNNTTRLFTTDRDSILNQLVLKKTRATNIMAQTSWIRPVSSNADIEVKYNFKSNFAQNKLVTNWEDENGKMRLIDSLSNQFTLQVVEHKSGINIKRKGEKLDLTIGANFIYTLYNSNKGKWIIPELNAAYNLNKKSRLSLHYEGHPNYPDYQQIRPIPDRSNPLYPVIGNPKLKAALYNMILLDYRYTGKNMFFVSLTGTPIIDKAVTNVILEKDTTGTIIQETRFLNANGNYILGGNYTFSIPFNDGRFQIFFEGSSNFSNNVFYLDNIRNSGSNVTLKQAIRTGTYLNWLEVNTTIEYGINHTKYSDKESGTQDIYTWNIQLNPKFIIGKTWSIWGTFNKQFNSGYSGGVTSNPTNLNVTVEKKFLRNALSCRMQGFNLLNQNTDLTQTITGNTITQTRSNQLGRYVLFSIYLDLKKSHK